MADFLYHSDTTYLFLPSRSNPKVALAIGSKKLIAHSFRLYNPFSRKAQLLKSFAFAFCNTFSAFPGACRKSGKSEFIVHLEKVTGKTLISSIYFSTDKDKHVIQLQTPEGQMLGYVKISSSDKGKERILNELEAVRILSGKGISTIELIDSGSFEDKVYIFFKEIEGIPAYLQTAELEEILNKFKKEEQYTLAEHPRVKTLLKQITDFHMDDLAKAFEKACLACPGKFYTAYEHGDFAPWNIMKNKNGKTELFDLEYFYSDGMEFLDLIKYHYQIGALLKRKSGKDLAGYIFSNVKHPYAKQLFLTFLLKEISLLISEKKDYAREEKLFKELALA